MDSVAIARYGERKGTGAALFPSAHETEIAAWNAYSETVMTCARAMLLPRMSCMPAALREPLPPQFRVCFNFPAPQHARQRQATP